MFLSIIIGYTQKSLTDKKIKTTTVKIDPMSDIIGAILQIQIEIQTNIKGIPTNIRRNQRNVFRIHKKLLTK